MRTIEKQIIELFCKFVLDHKNDIRSFSFDVGESPDGSATIYIKMCKGNMRAVHVFTKKELSSLYIDDWVIYNVFEQMLTSIT